MGSGEIGIKTRLVFPPHISLPISITITLGVASDQMTGLGWLLGGLGHAGVLGVTTTVAHRDRLRMNALHRHDRNSHLRNYFATTLLHQVISLQMRRILFELS